MSLETFTTIGVALALLPLAGLAEADHSMPCHPYIAYVPDDSLERTYPGYVMIDNWSSVHLLSIWIYAESNGKTGLQRDDAYCYTPGTTEDARDKIVF